MTSKPEEQGVPVGRSGTHILTAAGLRIESDEGRRVLPWEKVETISLDSVDQAHRITLRTIKGREEPLLLDPEESDGVIAFLYQCCPWAMFVDRTTGDVVAPRESLPGQVPALVKKREERVSGAVAKARASGETKGALLVILGILFLAGAIFAFAIGIEYRSAGAVVLSLMVLSAGLRFLFQGRARILEARTGGPR